MAEKEKQNEGLFDLCKKAAVVKQIKIASSAKDCKKLLEEKLQRNESKFPVPNILMLRCTTFLRYQSFHSASTYSLVLLVLVSSFSCCFTSCSIIARDYCSLQNERR